MSTPADLVNLRRRHAALLHDRPGLRAYDAAEALAASEVELVAAGCTGPVVRLRSDWKGIFEGLPALGTVMALTRNAHAVHEKVGRYEDVQVRAHGGLVLGPDIDLRLFLNRWHSAFAVTGERHRSLQFFDGQGRAVHKIFARPETDMSAWEGLIAGFGETGVPASLILRRGPSAPQKKPASGGREALRDAWAALKDTHDFVVMLSSSVWSGPKPSAWSAETWPSRCAIRRFGWVWRRLPRADSRSWSSCPTRRRSRSIPGR